MNQYIIAKVIKDYREKKNMTQQMLAAGKQLRDLGSTLGKTDHWYNWNNTPEFKNLLTALKELPTSDSEYKNMDKLTKNFEKIQNLAQKYIDKKNDKTLNKNGDARLEICKNILDLTKKTLSDDFFHKIVPNPEPGMTRTQIDFTNELQDDVEEYEDILDNSMDKTISFEKGSREEQEFFKE